MPNFKYIAIDSKGQKIKGQIEAKDRDSVVNFLIKEPITIVSIDKFRPQKLSFGKGKTVKLKDLIIFSRQLATLVKTGVPLVRGLGIISAQAENQALRNIVNSLQVNIEAGRSLSEALSSHPHVFSSIFINLVKAGEMGGSLDRILDRIAAYLEEADKLSRKVKGALVYPAIVVTMAIGIVAFLFITVIPSFRNMFDTLEISLPLPTRILIGTSEFIKSFYLYMLVGIVIVVILIRRYTRTSKGKLQFDRLCLKLPLFGSLFLKSITASFSRTLSTLIKSGISILNSLDIVAKTSGNVVVEDALTNARAQISRGEKIGESLRATGKGIFASLVIDMITVGEETGNISPMLDKIADFYEAEVDSAIAALLSLLEPLVIIFLGGLVGAIAVSLFLPILEILKKLS